MFLIEVLLQNQRHIRKKGYSSHEHIEPLELVALTKGTTDYLWYTTRFEVKSEDLQDSDPVLHVENLGHAMGAFVNGEYIGNGHGNNIDKSFRFQAPVNLKVGTNDISLLGMTVGLPDIGAYLEHRMAGVHAAYIQGLKTGKRDLSFNGWNHKVGMEGEKLRLYTQGGSHRATWTSAKGKGQPLTWYKRYCDTPEGDSPVAIDMSTMAKGMVWVNGQSIGRQWVSYLSPLGKPSQVEYHIPRPFLKPSDNLLVIFEEEAIGEASHCLSTTAELRHPNGCAKIISVHRSGWSWLGTLVIIILCLLGAYLVAGTACRFFALGIRGIELIPNLEFWLSLPHRTQVFFASLIRRFRRPTEGHESSYSPINF